MKISEKPHSSGSCAGGPQAARAGHVKPFGEVLKGQKKPAAETSSESRDKRAAPEPEERGKRDLPAATIPSGLAPASAPLPSLRDAAPVAPGQAIAQPEAILSSLVKEIAVAAPPGASPSVDIQFDSRTLQGLHVRIQKSGEGVEVKFTTSSAAVSRLLANNTESLAAALVQRGYVAPSISVQAPPPVPAPAAVSTGEGRTLGRDGGSRGRQDQRGGQKQR